MNDKITSNDLNDFLLDELGSSLIETEHQIQTFKKQTAEIDTLDISNFSNVMAQNLNQVVERGNNILQNIQQICNSIPDPEAYQAAASVLNSINSLMSNFITLYKLERNKLDKIELSKIEHQHKLEQIRVRNELRRELKEDGNEQKPTDLIEFNTQNIISRISKQQQNN